MKCPHCFVEIHSAPDRVPVRNDSDSVWYIAHETCPACNRAIISLIRTGHVLSSGASANVLSSEIVHPRFAGRPAPDKSVPEVFVEMYNEAAMLVEISPRASAALSRCCLQHLIREKAGIKKQNLVDEIKTLVDSNTLPPAAAHAIDHIRHYGNFAAHPTKNLTTGEIIPVEDGEAEWTLDVLDMLFDHFFVAPARIAERRAQLDAKLSAAGKMPTK